MNARTARLVDTGDRAFNGLVWHRTVPWLDLLDGTCHDYLATVPGGLAGKPATDGVLVLRLAEPWDPARVPVLDYRRGPCPGSTYGCPSDLPEAMALHLVGDDQAECPTCGTTQLVVGMAEVDPTDPTLLAPRLACGHTLED